MISLEEAKKIAKKYMPHVNAHDEEPKAYIFYDSTLPEGADDNEVVVLKQDGKVVSYLEYVMEIA